MASPTTETNGAMLSKLAPGLASSFGGAPSAATSVTSSSLAGKTVDTITPGVWSVASTKNASNSGVFKAVVEDFPGKKYHWYVNKKRLTSSHGELILEHPNIATLKYEITLGGKVITFTRSSVASHGFHFELGVKVTTTEHLAEEMGQNETSISDSRCIEVPAESSVFTEAAVSWAIYQSAFTRAFGSLEVQLAKAQAKAEG